MRAYKKSLMFLLITLLSCKAANSKTMKISMSGEKQVIVSDSGRAIYINDPEFTLKYSKKGIKNVKLVFKTYRGEIYQATKENKDIFPFTKYDLLKYKPFVPFDCVFESSKSGNLKFTGIYKDLNDIQKLIDGLKKGTVRDLWDLRNYNYVECKQENPK